MAKPTSRLGVEQFAGRGGPQDLPPSMLQYGVGLQLFDPSVYANGGGHTFADGIVASPGGGQLNATKLKAAINHITVCATAGDSLALPPAVGGQMLVVINDGIADAQVFAAPGSSDTINGVAGATGMALAPSTSVLLSAPGHHVWYSTPSGDAVGSSPGVTSWNTRVGAVTLTVGDVTAALPASATNPAMDGTAAPGVSPTWSAGDHVHPTDSTRYAASNPAGYVTAGGAATAAPVQSVATRTGAVTLTHSDITDWTATLAPYATLASPALSGNPTAPTPTAGDADTSIATTAFVQAAVVPAFNGTGRNLLHNPLFNVAQRGAGAFNATTAGWTYSLDRWALIIASAGDTFTHTPAAISDTQRTQIGDESAATELACNFTGGAGTANACISAQFIEGVRRLAGKTVTVSFYALAAGTSPRLGVSLDQFFGSGGSPSATVTGAGQSVTVSSATYARYSVTLTLPSISGKTLGTAGNDQTSLLFWHSAGANTATRSGNVGVQTGTHLIWGVQLEIGSVATPLEKPDPRYDLANCQRFYCNSSGRIDFYAAVSGAPASTRIALPVYMRAVPTLTHADSGNTNASGSTLVPLDQLGFHWLITGVGVGGTSLITTWTATADL